jgi:RimJ/RimL family protein N-acetyltransferase
VDSDDDPGDRKVVLPDGHTLTIRRMTEADAGALGALYEGLSLDDRHRRFFSVYHPSTSFLHHYAGTPEEKGYGLVALVTNGDERLVGEASYTLLPSGCGEFAITVARDWRGWLGPYLFDAMLDAASELAVPNLEADVLADNEVMLALARSRGGVSVARPYSGVVRVAVPASEAVPHLNRATVGRPADRRARGPSPVPA